MHQNSQAHPHNSNKPKKKKTKRERGWITWDICIGAVFELHMEEGEERKLGRSGEGESAKISHARGLGEWI